MEQSELELGLRLTALPQGTAYVVREYKQVREICMALLELNRYDVVVYCWVWVWRSNVLRAVPAGKLLFAPDFAPPMMGAEKEEYAHLMELQSGPRV